MILGLEVKVQFKFILALIFIDIVVVQNLTYMLCKYCLQYLLIITF